MSSHDHPQTLAIMAAKKRVAGLRAKYIETDRDRELKTVVDMLLINREENAVTPIANSKLGVVVTGASGAGKSRMLEKLFSGMPELRGASGDPIKPLVSMTVETPISLKSLGRQTLSYLEYGTEGSGNTRQNYWSEVRNQLELRQTKILHYDEFQDIFELAVSKRDIKEILATLKGVMGNHAWPTVLVLSGGPLLEGYIELDYMLARRLYRLPMPSITVGSGKKGGVVSKLEEYCTEVGLALPENSKELAARIIHASAYQLGRTFELMIDGMTEAILAGDERLQVEHFATALHRQAPSRETNNIFKAANWTDIKPLSVAEERLGPRTTSDKSRRKSGERNALW